ncbi:MAG TPA: histidine phosphatase family protein [Patescibacteria group bacterium]
MTNPCTFYIVRHGETEGNKQGILQGHNDTPLTEEGIRQAAERSATFKDIKFADAFSSDLFRTQHTAEIVLAERQLAVKTTQLLRERSHGIYDGQKYEVYNQELKELLEAREALSEEERFRHKIRDDIESDEEIMTRFLTFVRQTAVAYPHQNVLVVTHGGMIKTLLIHLGYVKAAQLHHGSISNLSYLVMNSDGVEFEVVRTEGISFTQN